MTKDVLVSAELAKEKLARICQNYTDPHDGPDSAKDTMLTAMDIAQLVRNTDLTDCQPHRPAATREQQPGIGEDCGPEKSGSIPDGPAELEKAKSDE